MARHSVKARIFVEPSDAGVRACIRLSGDTKKSGTFACGYGRTPSTALAKAFEEIGRSLRDRRKDR